MSRRYRQENKDKLATYRSLYRSKKLYRTPKWISKEDLARIKSIYKACNIISEKTGIKHHVDHIIPLQGENVCGLHVPWNLQYLPAHDNIKKGNKYE